MKRFLASALLVLLAPRARCVTSRELGSRWTYCHTHRVRFGIAGGACPGRAS